MKPTTKHTTKLSIILISVTLLSVVGITLVQRFTAQRINVQHEKARLKNLLELLPEEASNWTLLTRPIKAPGQFQSDASIT